MTKKTKVVRRISQAMAAILAFSACQQALVLPSFAESNLTLTPKFKENASVDVSGNKITVTDTNVNDDVWNSKALVDTGLTLVPGKQYTVDFNLDGQDGVGEFFLCKAESLEARYDDTFTTDSGSRCTTFTAVGEKLYIGMQVGNVGLNHSVTAEISSISETEYSADMSLLKTANCDAVVDGRTVTATDTAENNDVWDSKLLLDAGVALQVGQIYEMSVTLEGDNGVGEFFVCKSMDLNDRVDASFCNVAGTKNVTFKAESSRLYIGMQFGNIGKGNQVTMKLNKIQPFVDHSNDFYTVDVVDGKMVIVATDISKIDNVWDSRVLVPLNQKLVPGQKYEVTIDLSGTNGVGELFLLRRADMDNIDNRFQDVYENSIFSESQGLFTTVFEAEDTTAFIGMQMGNVGYGNVVTAEIDVKPYNEATGNDTGLKVAQNCVKSVTRSAGKNVIQVTDTSSREEVFSSKVMDYYGNVAPGKEYFSIVKLEGSTENVGEFFFTKTADPNLKADNDNRYDGTFRDAPGTYVETFTTGSNDDKVYAGLQFGNVGEGESVILTYTDPMENNVAVRDNCVANISEDQTKLVGVDTDGEHNGVWESKLVQPIDNVTQKGKQYIAKVKTTSHPEIEGAQGELMLDKGGDMYNPVIYADTRKDGNPEGNNECKVTTDGEHTFSFEADDDLNVVMQFGNLGYSGDYTVEVTDFYERPLNNLAEGEKGFDWCIEEEVTENSVTLKSNSEGTNPWESKALYDTGVEVEAGKEYTVSYTLTGSDDKAQVFFKGGSNIYEDGDRYNDTFSTEDGTHTYTITSTGDKLYIGMSIGEIGKDNTVTISDVTVTEVVSD